ncbi:MAG: tetratricopeptide repeat protein [Okeania sp. SIO3H1]|nr:tetratricopeptide repeat protein [Okeania sp. SIO3H1]
MSNRKTIHQLIAQISHNTLTIFMGGQFILPSSFFLLPSSFFLPSSFPLITQNTETKDSNLDAAQRAAQEGIQLFKQQTAESQQQAIEKFQEAAKLYQAAGDEAKAASSLNMIGLVYYSLSNYQKSLEYYQQVLSLREKLNHKEGKAYILASIGIVYSDLGEKTKSLDTFNQSLQLFRELKNLSQQAFVLRQIGMVYFSLGEIEKAQNSFDETLEIQRSENDTKAEADTLQTLAMIYVQLGDNQKASQYLKQAQALQNSTPNNDHQTDSSKTEDLFVLPTTIEEHKTRIDALKKQLSKYQQIGNRGIQGDTLYQIGIIYANLGDYQQALNYYKQALEIQREVGNPQRVASTLNNIGETYLSLGNYQDSLNIYNEARKLQNQIGDRSGEADTISAIATFYEYLGDYQPSLESYQQALAIFRDVGSLLGQAQTLDSIATIYRIQEKYKRALKSAQEAEEIWEKQGNNYGQVSTLSTIVRIYEDKSDYEPALAAADKILSLGEKFQQTFHNAIGLALKGKIYLAMEDYEKALTSYTEALEITRNIGNRKLEAPILDNIGNIYKSSDKPTKAIDSYQQALTLWEQLGDRPGQIKTRFFIAETQRNQGNLTIALETIEAALDIVESQRTKIASSELRASYFATVQDYYEFYIDLLMELHQQQPNKDYEGKALQANERSRARTLLEILTEANADIRQGVDPELLRQEKLLLQQLEALEERRVKLLSGETIPEQIKAIEQDRETILRQYQQTQAQIRATSPRYAALTQPQPLTLNEIQKKVLDDETLLLQYSLGEKRSYLWAVSKTEINSYQLPPRTEIEKAALEFRLTITDSRERGNIPKVDTTTDALSKILLEPVADKLKEKRLLIVSDGMLQYIPFAALSLPATTSEDAGYQPLIVNHEIINLPSASTVAILRQETATRRPAPKTVAIIADPVFNPEDERVSGVNATSTASISQMTRAARDVGIKWERLPGTREEAEAIMALVPEGERTESFDFQANRETVNSRELGKYRILHLATHGFANSQKPELSGVVMSLVNKNGSWQNGFLRLNDIYNLSLPVELVVLSACQTALGKNIRGEGLVGLTRGFMYAGTPRVVASLWRVDDVATAELMSQFYQGMLEDGFSPVEALREAQLQLLQEEGSKSPYYWASFTLQGEWH